MIKKLLTKLYFFGTMSEIVVWNYKIKIKECDNMFCPYCDQEIIIGNNTSGAQGS